jgi:hypothetical protein
MRTNDSKRSSVMDARAADAVLSTFENVRSASAVVTGNVASMRSSIMMFGSET